MLPDWYLTREEFASLVIEVFLSAENASTSKWHPEDSCVDLTSTAEIVCRTIVAQNRVT